jgi:hypothetical protein
LNATQVYLAAHPNVNPPINFNQLQPIPELQQDLARRAQQLARPNIPHPDAVNDPPPPLGIGQRPVELNISAPLHELVAYSIPCPPFAANVNIPAIQSWKEMYWAFDDVPQFNLFNTHFHHRLDRSLCCGINYHNHPNQDPNRYLVNRCQQKLLLEWNCVIIILLTIFI